MGCAARGVFSTLDGVDYLWRPLWGTITDVDGIRVGHCTRDEPGWLTGVTVVVPPPGTVAGVDVRGGGPGTRETDLLDPRNLVETVDAIVLSGGSAFGLATADGVMQEAYAAGLGFPIGPGEQRVPIVPAAILFDLGRGGHWLHHPTAADGATAFRAASTDDVEQGCVGAGTGARAGGLRGGLGSASAQTPGGLTIGVVVAVNAVGSPVAGDGSLLGLSALGESERHGIPRASPTAAQAYWRERAAEQELLRAGTATTIGVLATDARLTKAQCATLAGAAHDGLARAVSPVHTAYDGDTFFTLATGSWGTPTPADLMDLHIAAAEVTTRAIARAMLAATSVDRSGEGGLRALSWRDALTGDRGSS